MLKLFCLLGAVSNVASAPVQNTIPQAPVDVVRAQTFFSIQGDRLHALLGSGPKDQRLPQAVQICLANAPENFGTKGFGTGGGVPDLVVAPGEVVCKPLAPVPHQILLWAQDTKGIYHPRVQTGFDLRGQSGHTLWITWQREAPTAQD